MRKKLLEIIGLDESIYSNFIATPDHQGWSDDSTVFKEILETLNPNLIIEVGSWKGSSAIELCKICKELGHNNTQILCVDTWLGSEEYYTWLTEFQPDLKRINGYPSLYYTFLSNILDTGFQDKIIPFATTSIIAAKVLNHFNIRAEMVYLDASHDYDSVKKDLDLYYNLLNLGGCLIGDDYSSTWQGVIDAATEFAKEKNVELEIHKSRFVIRKE